MALPVVRTSPQETNIYIGTLAQLHGMLQEEPWRYLLPKRYKRDKLPAYFTCEYAERAMKKQVTVPLRPGPGDIFIR